MVAADFWPECVRVAILECKRLQGRYGAVRSIEVKVRARTGTVALTPNEWLMAQRLGREYWLYVVEHAATAAELYVVQDPAAKLQPDEVIEVVRYGVKGWKEAATG